MTRFASLVCLWQCTAVALALEVAETFGVPNGSAEAFARARVELHRAVQDGRVAGAAHLVVQSGKRLSSEAVGFNTDLLRRLIEVWPGESLDRYLRRAVFEPLEMVDTGFSVTKEKRSRFASCHIVRDGKLAVLDPAASGCEKSAAQQPAAAAIPKVSAVSLKLSFMASWHAPSLAVWALACCGQSAHTVV